MAATHTVVVKYSAGAHVTQTVQGQRASSTSSAEQAAKALGAKLFPKGAFKVRLVEQGKGAEQTWEISS